MGLFRELFGKEDDTGRPKDHKKIKLKPEYRRIHKWIEHRIGPIDPNDPGLQIKLDQLLHEEQNRYVSPKGKLIFSTDGNDTIITGDTQPFINLLKRRGCRWDRQNKCWKAQNKHLTEDAFNSPGQTAGLEAYIKSMPYRRNFDNPDSY